MVAPIIPSLTESLSFCFFPKMIPMSPQKGEAITKKNSAIL